MRILLLGSSGLLGQEIYKNIKLLKKSKIFHNGLLKKKKDLLKNDNLQNKILVTKPDLIINSLAISNIETCEKYKSQTEKINVEIVKKIFFIQKKFKLKFFLIQFSTDQVYDSKKLIFNKENSKIKINNEYTRQKIKLEKICIKNKALIFRTNFYGKNKKNTSITDWIFKSFNKQKKIFLFEDVYFNPIRIDTLCKIIKKIIINKLFSIYGLFNLGSKNYISKSNFAIYFAKNAKIYNNNYVLKKVNNCLKIKRSKNMVMNVLKFEKKFKIRLPEIRSEIKKEAKKYLNG